MNPSWYLIHLVKIFTVISSWASSNGNLPPWQYPNLEQYGTLGAQSADVTHWPALPPPGADDPWLGPSSPYIFVLYLVRIKWIIGSLKNVFLNLPLTPTPFRTNIWRNTVIWSFAFSSTFKMEILYASCVEMSKKVSVKKYLLR